MNRNALETESIEEFSELSPAVVLFDIDGNVGQGEGMRG